MFFPRGYIVVCASLNALVFVRRVVQGYADAHGGNAFLNLFARDGVVVTPTLILMTVTPTPTVAFTATPTVAFTATPTVAFSATPTVVLSPTPTVAFTATPTVVLSPTPTVAFTATPTVVLSPTPTVAFTATPTVVLSPTPTVAFTATPTVALSPTPTVVFSPTPTTSECPSGEVLDVCGVCGAPRNGSALQDCAGVCLGDAFVNQCGHCVNGTTGLDSAFGLDVCNVCDGNGTSCLGCDGVPFSNATFDYCATCGGNNTACILLDHIAPTTGINVDGVTIDVFGAGFVSSGGVPRTVLCVIGDGGADTEIVTATVLSASRARCTLTQFNTTGVKDVALQINGVTAAGSAVYTVVAPVTCAAETYGNTTWPATIANTTGTGSCGALFVPTGGLPPTRACLPSGNWSSTITNACTRT